MKRIWLYVGLGVVAFAAVAAVAMATAFVVFGRLMADSTETAAKSEVVTLDKGVVLPLDGFVTNLHDPAGASYVNVTFHLWLESDKNARRIQTNMPLVRDAVVRLLGTKKPTDIVGEAGQIALKNDVMSRINAELGADLVKRVLITEFVVQY